MKKLLSFLVLFSSSYAYSQYYYLDILGTKQTNQQYKLIQAHQLKRINATSFDANNEAAKDFVLEQSINKNGQEIVTRSSTIGSVESVFTSNYQSGKLTHTSDSGSHAINTVDYHYDNAGRLVETNSTSKDFDGTFTSHETHVWSYNEKGL